MVHVEEPGELDILCGKDKTYNKHSGNLTFRTHIMSMTTEYRNALTKPERMKLTKRIVNELKENVGARFLRAVTLHNEKIAWEEINETQARDKVSHALRFALKKEDIQRNNPQRQRGRSKNKGNKNQPKNSISLTTPSSITNVAYAASSAPASLPKSNAYRARKRTRRFKSEDGSDSTVVTESDAVSNASSFQLFHDDVLDDDFNPIVYRKHSQGFHHSQLLFPTRGYNTQSHGYIVTPHDHQQVHSSPAMVGEHPATSYYASLQDTRGLSAPNLKDDADDDDMHHYHNHSHHYPQRQHHPGGIHSRQASSDDHLLDMTVKSDDLNDFLDDDIECDWNSPHHNPHHS